MKRRKESLEEYGDAIMLQLLKWEIAVRFLANVNMTSNFTMCLISQKQGPIFLD